LETACRLGLCSRRGNRLFRRGLGFAAEQRAYLLPEPGFCRGWRRNGFRLRRDGRWRHWRNALDGRLGGLHGLGLRSRHIAVDNLALDFRRQFVADLVVACRVELVVADALDLVERSVKIGVRYQRDVHTAAALKRRDAAALLVQQEGG